jgi:hypothetical protein
VSLTDCRHNGELLISKVTGETRGRTSPAKFQSLAIAVALFSVLVWLATFKQAMQVPFSHDEHQFVAAGRLVADGLLPYRDFPFNHMPYLALVYGTVFKMTSWNLLPARVVSAVSAALAAGLVFLLASAFFRTKNRFTRFAISASASLLLITNPIFRYTSGRAWNHDLPTLLTLLAVLFFLRGRSPAFSGKRILASGALVGLAMGIRLTYLLALLPFVLVSLVTRRQEGRPGWRSEVGAFGAGMVLASLPWMAIFAVAPRQFIFGNITYQTLNTDYREILAHRVGETLLGKAVYFYHVLVDEPGNLILFLAFAIVAIWIMVHLVRRRAEMPQEVILLGGLTLVLLAGAFAATPSWYQYFYASVPFLILATVCGLSVVWPLGIRWEHALSWTATIVMMVSGVALLFQSDWASVRDPTSWIPVEAHELGTEVGQIVGEGKVLTLSPIFPLEGGLGIYNSLATGPFSWRVAPLLTEEQRREFGLLSYTDLETVLRNDPPAAIMVGFEAGNEGFELGSKGGLEAPLDDYAQDHGYSPVILTTPLMEDEVRLWLR